MSTISNVVNTRNQSTTNYETSKLLLGDNEFAKANYTDSGAGSSLTEGMVMGRIAATEKIVPLDSAAVDGSQMPVGLAIVAETVTAAATTSVNLVNKGRVAEAKVTFKSGIALDDVIDGRTLRDWLNAIGLVLKGGTEMTAYDNQ